MIRSLLTRIAWPLIHWQEKNQIISMEAQIRELESLLDNEVEQHLKLIGDKMTEDMAATYATIDELQLQGNYDELRQLVNYAADAIKNDGEQVEANADEI